MSWLTFEELQSKVVLSDACVSWLTYTGSTTARWRDEFGMQVAVEVLDRAPFPCVLYQGYPKADMRHVLLYVCDKPWMIASAFLPKALAREKGRSQDPIGTWFGSTDTISRQDMCFQVFNLNRLHVHSINMGARKRGIVRKSLFCARKVSFPLIELFIFR